MSRRRSEQGKPLRRRVGTRLPRKTLVVFCEGERTEPEYLRALKLEPEVRDVAAVDLRVESVRNGASPEELVRRAVEARTRSSDEEGEVDEVWCVFDVEWPQNHPSLRHAVQLAATNDVQVAVSNPCFELWLVLHFVDHRAWLNTVDATQLRSQQDGSTTKGINSALYMPRRIEAARRAEALEKMHERNGVNFPEDNPSSGMYLLLASVTP